MITGKWFRRGSVLRNFLERYVVGKKKFQSIFNYIYLFAIAGLNYGEGSSVSSSGEHFVMEYFRNKWTGSAPPLIFDIGGNVGNYSNAMLDCFKAECKILAFEPSPSTFKIFSKNVNSKYVTAHNFGFSDSEGKLLLYSDGEGSGLASVYQRSTTVSMDRQEEISLTTIDTFCRQENIDRINFMKIDVEGHELKVLQGAKGMLENKAIDLIQFEFGGCNVDSRTYFHDFWELLHHDFDLYRVLKDGLQPILQYSLLDEIFVTVNFVAVKKNN